MTNKYEESRIKLQIELDSLKDKQERNKLGQYSTPKKLADDLIVSALKYLDSDKKIRFLDPAIGTGVFFSSLIDHASPEKIESALGYEIDSHYVKSASKLWETSLLNYVEGDFLEKKCVSDKKFNLIICNPPYVRHHYIESEQKQKLFESLKNEYDIEFSKLSGLYCYFMALAEKWLSDDGISAWLVPCEFLDVNYGSKVKEFLLTKVNLLRIHKYNPSNLKFNDALVSSAVVYYSKKNKKNGFVNFTVGDDINNPSCSYSYEKTDLAYNKKWSPLFSGETQVTKKDFTISDFFTVKRGIATGGNKYFILKKSKVAELKIPSNFLKPIIPSPRMLKSNQTVFQKSDEELYLLNVTCDENELNLLPIELQEYLNTAKNDIGKNYLISKRKPWYRQETRKKCPFLVTYMSRDAEHPVRFILNYTDSIAANGYLMLFPKFDWENAEKENSGFLKNLHDDLLHTSARDLLASGRIYGGGLFKLEPKELLNLSIGSVLSKETLEIIQKYDNCKNQ